MKKVHKYIFLLILLIIFLTGILLLPLSIFQFVRFTDKHAELNDFYNDNSIFTYNPNDNSGSYESSTPISLPDTGRFTIIVFCYDTTKQNTPYNVELNLDVNINGISNEITLKDKSYVKNSYFYKGEQIINPGIEKAWESNLYTINSNMSLEFSWDCNFDDWNLYVLYTNDLIDEQRNDIRSAKSNGFLLFGWELGFSIPFIVVGAIGSIISIVFLRKSIKNQKRNIQPIKAQINSTIKKQEDILIKKVIYCSKCGEKLENGTEFCHSCGNKI